jgi:protein-tyrosine phosphatase
MAAEHTKPVRDDLHTHVLPGWDDGAQDQEQSLTMIARAWQAGVRRMVVTPHISLHQAGPRAAAEIAESIKQLQQALSVAGIDMELIPAAELTLSGELLVHITSEPWLTIGGQGRYVLVMADASFTTWPVLYDDLLFKLRVHQITPIICHPERSGLIQRNPEILRGPFLRGALVQITADSLTAQAPPAVRKCANRLLRHGLVSLIASDMHKADDILPTQISEQLQRLVGVEKAQAILVENPARVIAGEMIENDAFDTENRKGFWFLRRHWQSAKLFALC